MRESISVYDIHANRRSTSSGGKYALRLTELFIFSSSASLGTGLSRQEHAIALD
jgi:hypothetical protein